MNNQIKSTLYLIVTAMIWGFAFVAQRTGMSHIGPFTFSAFRMLIGTIALTPVVIYFDKKDKTTDVKIKKARHKMSVKGGIICGCVMFFASNFQQIGLVEVSAGKSAFITTLYIVFVPICAIFFKHKTSITTWIAVILGTIGLYLLCITEKFTISTSDILLIICAFFWTGHIYCIDHFATKTLVPKLILFQTATTGLLSFIVAIFAEDISMSGVMPAMGALLYTGVLSSAIAFALQAVGQKLSSPTTASIIMSTESLFAVVGGFIFLGETFTQRETIACVIIFIAIIFAQLPNGIFKIKRHLI